MIDPFAKIHHKWYPAYMANKKHLINAIIVAMLALAISGCPKKPIEPAPLIPEFDSAEELITFVQDRAAKTEMIDANIEAKLTGGSALYRGRFFGSLRVDRDDDALNLRIQAYSAAGLPVLEFTSMGERMMVHSPLERAAYYNFTELIEDEHFIQLPLTSFQDVAMPVQTLADGLEAVYGLGLSGPGRYDLSRTEDEYIVTEWEDMDVRRRMVYSRPDALLSEITFFNSGIPAGAVEFAGYGDGAAAFLPREISLSRDETGLSFTLKDVRTGTDVKGGPITFEPTKAKLHVLLTPPVP